jgi:hypothetical protein
VERSGQVRGQHEARLLRQHHVSNNALRSQFLPPNEFAPSTARKDVGLAAVLQPDMFDVCCLKRYARTSGKSHCLAVIRKPGATQAGSIPSQVRKGEPYPKAVSQMHPREERGYRKSRRCSERPAGPRRRCLLRDAAELRGAGEP